MARRKTRPARRRDTRARILEAAARTFADRGFRGATVREICARAGANVAAVNYHFGSKSRLAEETLRFACAVDPTEPWMLPPAGRPDPERRLREAIRGFGARFFGPRPPWRPRLLQRAMTEGPANLVATARAVYAPRFEALRCALRPFLPRAGPRALTLATMSVVGQLAYYRTAGPLALSHLGERAYDEGLRDEILDHVAEFTLRGLRAPPRGRRA